MKATRLPWIVEVALPYAREACLIWPFSVRGGRRTKDAYPALCGGYAHVKLCEIVHGPRPTPAHETEHLCGNKLCMNKRHIQWALHPANCARRTEHGTQTIGEKHPRAILTEKDVLEIRKSKARGVDLAKRYGVSPAAICIARKGKTWRHL